MKDIYNSKRETAKMNKNNKISIVNLVLHNFFIL